MVSKKEKIRRKTLAKEGLNKNELIKKIKGTLFWSLLILGIPLMILMLVDSNEPRNNAPDYDAFESDIDNFLNISYHDADTTEGVIKGPIIIIDKTNEGIHPAFERLYSVLAAKTPDEIRTVVWVETELKEVRRYSGGLTKYKYLWEKEGGMPGLSEMWKISVIDIKDKELLFSGNIESIPPPDLISKIYQDNGKWKAEGLGGVTYPIKLDSEGRPYAVMGFGNSHYLNNRLAHLSGYPTFLGRFLFSWKN